jgi:hypothetical protein
LIATALTHHLEALLNALQDQTLHANNDSMISGVFQHNRPEAGADEILPMQPLRPLACMLAPYILTCRFFTVI